MAAAMLLVPLKAMANPSSTEVVAYRQEIASLDASLQQDPRDIDAYLKRGWLQAKLERYTPAIEDYSRAIALDPDLTVAYTNRASAKINLKNYWGAYEDYTQVIRLEPNKAITYNNRAIVRRQLGDCKGAIADLKISALLFRQQGDNEGYQQSMANLKVFSGSKKGW
jgi:tetratricopeptide (TPR) repeat protein